MKLRFWSFPLIFLIIIFVSGCVPETTTAEGYYKYIGERAVEARFAPDAPVSSELESYTMNDQIPVIVELTNRLTEEVSAGRVKIRLTGDAAVPNFFTGAKQVTNPSLEGIDITTGGTAPEEIDLGPIKYVGELTAKVKKTITGKYCYEAPIKVKANAYYTDNPQEIGKNLVAGSNPPSSVKVVNVSQGIVRVDRTTNKGSMDLKIIVANTNPVGQVLDNMNECFQYQGKRARERVYMDVKGAYPITCDNNGEVILSLSTRTKMINCDVTGIDTANLGPLASELAITLSGFAYEDEIPPVTVWLEP